MDEYGRSDGSLFIDDGESDFETTSNNPKITMSVSDSILSVYPASLPGNDIPKLGKIIIQPIRAQINRVSIDVITENDFEVINLERSEFDYDVTNEGRVSTDHCSMSKHPG